MLVIETIGDLPADMPLLAPDFYVEHFDSVQCEWIESDGCHKKAWYKRKLLSPYSGRIKKENK